MPQQKHLTDLRELQLNLTAGTQKKILGFKTFLHFSHIKLFIFTVVLANMKFILRLSNTGISILVMMETE